MARRLTPEEFGVPTVHFYLLSTAILTTREGFRRALMRDSVKDASLGYAWLVLPIGGFLSIVIPLGVIWSQNISLKCVVPFILAIPAIRVMRFYGGNSLAHRLPIFLAIKDMVLWRIRMVF